MTLILPGVELKVVKDIVVGQLNPSGVLGLVGLAPNINGTRLVRAKSYSEIVSKLGPSVAYSIPEARQALANGVGQLVMVPVHSSSAKAASVEIPLEKGAGTLLLKAKGPGLWGNSAKVSVKKKPDENGIMTKAKVELDMDGEQEVYDNVCLDTTDPRDLVAMINGRSTMVEASLKDTPVASKTTGDDKKKDKPKGHLTITEGTYALEGGKPATMGDYVNAIAELETEDDVDLVAASLEDWTDDTTVRGVHAAIEAHCQNMSKTCMNRIGLGTIPPCTRFADADEEVEFTVRQTNAMASDRFVLVAPNGVLGAVSGLVGNLDVHESPTFKALSGVGGLQRRYTPTQLEQLLKANILALEERRGRGIIVEKGVLTSGEQVSVQRVADKAVRGVKMIGDKFIGTLNNASGRSALREKITEFFIQMEKDGAIVPSADGSDPAYKVDVYATDDDISKGIVRCDVAVRPVRAIDYVYGTIFVRA